MQRPNITEETDTQSFNGALITAKQKFADIYHNPFLPPSSFLFCSSQQKKQPKEKQKIGSDTPIYPQKTQQPKKLHRLGIYGQDFSSPESDKR